MGSQPNSMAWTVTSRLDFIIVEVTWNILFYELEVLYIFDINMASPYEIHEFIYLWFDERQRYIIFTHA